MTASTVTDIDGLLGLLADARRLRYALNNQEAFVGDVSIAAPLIGASGIPLGAVNIAVPSPRWKVEDVQKSLAPQLLETAREITSALRDL
jgi:IclR family transcriptional regulator, pca regulon regulatory protein